MSAMADTEASALNGEPQIADVRRNEIGPAGESSNAMSARVPQEDSPAPEASPEAAVICAISDIKLEKDPEVWVKEKNKAVTAMQEPTPKATPPPVDGVSRDDEDVHEAENAGGALEGTFSARPEGTPGLNPAEKTEASEAPATTSVQPHRPPVMGEPGWEKAPDRPPQKLPIRFKDCLGRSIMIPWKVAKSWPSMRNLIRSSFTQLDVLHQHVAAGRYDLFVQNMWLAEDSAAVNPELMSFHHSVPPTVGGSNSASGPATATPVPGSWPSSPYAASLGLNSSVILPELWEDIVEPGMLVVMLAWPIVRPAPLPVPPPAPGATLPPPVPGCPIPPSRRKTRKRQG